jgi:hypothetical protein
MTWKASLEHFLVGRLAIIEMPVSPTARGRVFLRVLHHELNSVLGSTCDEGLVLTKGFVVLRGREVAPGQTGNDCSVRKWKLLFPVRFDGLVVSKNRADVVEIALLARDGDELPVTVSRRDCLYERTMAARTTMVRLL